MKRIFPLFLALLLLPGCIGSPAETTPPPSLNSTLLAMDTVMTFTVNGDKAQEGLDAVKAEITRLEGLLSVTLESSDVWNINHSGGEPVDVSDDTLALLRAATDIGQATGGALDVTLYPVVKAWGFTTSAYQIPDDATLQDLLSRVDYQAITQTGSTVTLPDGMELDFGALAKGYAGERCAQLLREQGVTSALLRLSGNIQAVGAKPDGSPWRVAIQDPAGTSGQGIGVLELIDQAAVTSGGYERYFEVDGVRYWHIIDPATGAPARSGLTSVTIVSDSGTLCDGLSTALFIMGREKGLELWRQRDDFEAILVDDEGVWVTAGLADTYIPMEDCPYTTHIVEE